MSTSLLTLHSLFKGSGSQEVKENHRGIMTADDLGKAVHRSRVEDLGPYAESYLCDSQCCGVGHRGTDFCAMMVRQFLAWAKHRGFSAAVLFVDVKAAFYSVVWGEKRNAAIQVLQA